MNRLLTALCIAIPSVVAASDILPNPCVVPGSSVDISAFDAMTKDLEIKKDSVDQSKTKLELFDNRAVGSLLAEQLARKAKRETTFVKYKDLLAIYTDDNPRNLIVKYTYENKQTKRNILIGSAIVNDSECSIDFNGYIIVSREF